MQGICLFNARYGIFAVAGDFNRVRDNRRLILCPRRKDPSIRRAGGFLLLLPHALVSRFLFCGKCTSSLLPRRFYFSAFGKERGRNPRRVVFRDDLLPGVVMRDLLLCQL